MNLLNELDEEINIEEWIFGPGIPESVVIPESDKFEKVDAAVNAFLTDKNLKDQDWTTHEWLHFIRHLPTDSENVMMNMADKKYDFSNSGNSEIAAAWYELSIKSGYSQNNTAQIENFLVNVGRRKFLTPLYRALKESGQLEEAQRIYKLARKNYHSVSVQTMDKLLEYGE